MAARSVVVQQFFKPIKILKWKVKEGNSASLGRILLIYRFEGSDPETEQRKLRCTHVGIVSKILRGEGAVIKTGEPLLELKACIHPTVMNDMCADCGEDLRKEDNGNNIITVASVPMVHSIPELKVSEELAQKLGKADNERLLQDRKLVLLVDLDQTLIHTTNDNIPANIKDVFHFQLYGPTSSWYHTRFRPRTIDFLFNISQYFELHICTFGARNYAHMIAMLLDPDQQYFSNRILSRDECFDPNSKKANLKALFPCGDDMVCIIDDREDVWSNALNLIHVKPYHFFQHTGDINAPPGLNKQENDDRGGVDLTKTKTKNNGHNVKDKDENDGKEESGDVKNEDMYDPDVEKAEIDDDEESSEEIEEPNGAFKTKESSEEESVKTDRNCEEHYLIEECSAEDKKEEDVDVAEKDAKIENTNNSNSNKHRSSDLKNSEMSRLSETTELKDSPTNKTKKQNENPEEAPNNKTEIETSEQPSSNERPNSDHKDNVNDVSKSVSDDAKETDQTDNNVKQNDGMIEVDDPDDYLLYLEDILRRIHTTFYEEYDSRGDGTVPDLKQVIPRVRSQVLTDTKLVFSGLVPTHARLEESRAFLVAKGLGAEVARDLGPDITHLVAVRTGTAKVNAVRKRYGGKKSKKDQLKVVTPDWLWCCAERWERVREEVFPLDSKGSKNRHPPPHCSSPEHKSSAYPTHDTPAARKRTPSGRFMDTINPLMSFSSDDIADMDKEVEDMLDSDDSSSSTTNQERESFEDRPIHPPKATDLTSLSGNVASPQRRKSLPLPPMRSRSNSGVSDSSSTSTESLTGEFPRGFKRSYDQRVIERFHTSPDELNEPYDNIHRSAQEDEDDSVNDEFPSAKFRRGEEWSSDLDIGQDSEDDGSEEPRDDNEDGEWNVMGAALEREFLSNN